MRQVEKQILASIRARKERKMGNTRVRINETCAMVELHGNKIAVYDYAAKALFVTFAGWRTPTTKSRINALCAGLKGDAGGFVQRNFTMQPVGDVIELGNGWYKVGA